MSQHAIQPETVTPSATHPLMRNAVFDDGFIDAGKVRAELGLSLPSFAMMLGLPAESLRKRDRSRGKKVQKRLRELTAIIDRVTPWAGSQAQAAAWYRSQEIPALGLTPEQAVKTDRSSLVWAYIDHITQGGYA